MFICQVCAFLFSFTKTFVRTADTRSSFSVAKDDAESGPMVPHDSWNREDRCFAAQVKEIKCLINGYSDSGCFLLPDKQPVILFDLLKSHFEVSDHFMLIICQTFTFILTSFF